MGSLTYSMIMSVDGYIADENGNIDWTVPDAEVHAFVNEVERPIGTYLFGRRMHEVMSVWDDLAADPDLPEVEQEFGRLWQEKDKIVYSSTLESVTTARTKLEREFRPEAVRQLKESAERDLSVGGPTLAAHAFKAGLVDECIFYIAPVSIGGGTPGLPPGQRLSLELRDERRFGNGVVYLRYSVRQ
ncbi:deaminase-reductase domain-containing protein [Arthrobacter crystallopoietes BAB-32]|uniref:Deaminase-reductase domain-containing protein n=1 Tax=Arthrobacter crystallopoietes BAB-32 TaxID=1246476 RepID=N1V2S8_9MICC|nr:dihydrofolate reductase family protein [Arthrobacter crystallopoietes]EMY32563.1 deaminase-reductase domain-containing protein [Arthrobacter crystallopoietes BAB-32]